MSKKLIVALSAAIISAKMTGALAAPQDHQTLDELQRLIEGNNLTSIRDFLTSRDDLITGEDALAVAARLVLEQTSFQPGEFEFDVVANNGRGRGRGYVPWSDRPGKGRKDPPPKHPHIY